MFSLPFFFLLSIAHASIPVETVKLCNIELQAEERIDFTATEEKWLCGDPDTTAWKTIPLSQQKLFLRGFLQSKGFHSPEMEEKNGQLLVRAGAVHRVKSFEVLGAPTPWDWSKRWDMKGQKLDPDALNEATKWAKRSIQERGYPCPRVTPLAFVDSGLIQLNVTAGPPLFFGEIESPAIPDLDPAILERFTAFLPGQAFDVRLLELTSSRILVEDLYLSTYYDVLCDESQKARIVRRFVPALPRLFTVGAGFDTERGPLGRARMKWARLGKAANSLEASLFASIKEQSLTSRYHYYFSSDLSSRLKLIPSLSFERLNKKSFDTLTSQFGLNLANSWEKETLQLSGEAGPLLERVNILRGLGAKRVDNIRLTSKWSAMSHLFEYHLSNPRQGWMGSVETSSQFGGVLSDQSVHRVTLQHQILWNLGNREPPLLILGWRGLVGSYFFNLRTQNPADIAGNQRYFLGGDENIRGFGSRALPGNGLGFFTSIYQGVELRTGDWFPLHLQPFLFFDLAKGGTRPRKLERTTYYAPGLGIRYDSPIGSMRASLGHGFVTRPGPWDPENSLHFFFSFGREF